jgi:hypothetical protein
MAGFFSLETLKIVLFAIAAVVVYGVLHDLVTAHICVEYFTIAHPPVFATGSPSLLALGWGIIATWWVGALLGAGLAAAARIGSDPKIGLSELRLPIVTLMIVAAAFALLGGAVGAMLFSANLFDLPAKWSEAIPARNHIAFATVAGAHEASYGAAALGGLYLIGRTAVRRRRARRNEVQLDSVAGNSSS